MAFDEAALQAMVAEWYAALDRHDELPDVLAYLAEDGLEMVLPETTVRGRDGFAEWYERVTNRFFDEVHSITSMRIVSLTEDRAELKIVVNWQPRIWDPPAPNSQWLGFDSYQTWEVTPGPDGTPRISRYVVDDFQPMPGSPSL